MDTLDRMQDKSLDQDTAIRRALEATDRGLFDVDSDYEDIVEEAWGQARKPVRRAPAKRQSPT